MRKVNLQPTDLKEGTTRIRISQMCQHSQKRFPCQRILTKTAAQYLLHVSVSKLKPLCNMYLFHH